MQVNQLKDKIDAKKSILYNEVIDMYTNSKMSLEDEETREIVKNSIDKAIKEFVIESEVSEIVKRSENEIEKIEQISRVRQIKVIIIETLILGCLVGLLVNQVTDIISILKGGNIDTNQTVMWILILLILNLCFGIFMYINKLDEIFIKKINNDVIVMINEGWIT